jgi:hypothetical protein
VSSASEIGEPYCEGAHLRQNLFSLPNFGSLDI